MIFVLELTQDRRSDRRAVEAIVPRLDKTFLTRLPNCFPSFGRRFVPLDVDLCLEPLLTQERALVTLGHGSNALAV